MIANYLRFIEFFLATYGIAAVFLLGVAEEIFFMVPMSLLFVAIGFLMINPRLKFGAALLDSIVKVALPGMLGVVAAGLLVYGIVYWGGKKLVRRFGGYFGIEWEDVQAFQRKFDAGHIDEFVLTFLRVIPVLPIGVVSIFCGFVRVAVWEFIWTTTIGTIVRLAGLSLLGWYLGREYLRYSLYLVEFERYAVFGILVIGLAALIWIHIKARAKKTGA